jgi:hypothetical protein
MGFFIDKKGNCLYSTDLATVYYPASEPIKDENGKTLGHRQFMMEFQPKPKISTAEEMGWFKKIQFKDVVVLRIPDRHDYNKIKPKLFMRTIEIDTEKYFEFNKCGHCTLNNHGHRFHYLKAATDAILGICWACSVHYGRTAFTIQTLQDVRGGQPTAWCRVISEKPISVKQAVEFYQETGKVMDGTVRMLLGEREGLFEAG